MRDLFKFTLEMPETTMTARTARVTVAQEIGSIGKFIVERLEHKPGSSETLSICATSSGAKRSKPLVFRLSGRGF